jgi:hypothetical protein
MRGDLVPQLEDELGDGTVRREQRREMGGEQGFERRSIAARRKTELDLQVQAKRTRTGLLEAATAHRPRFGERLAEVGFDELTDLRRDHRLIDRCRA